ncbi:hypothetical protein HPB51_022091 [Rhipicephalus microplus]|uniref:CUB domain-containing protein n=1 Tax=Rhipicephalus microplus TaxID=6941 RepID=A0A9J6EIH5_RHIMP|nr:hypothetical protein HPB51_022091 [Rhipicephalus microplus]
MIQEELQLQATSSSCELRMTPSAGSLRNIVREELASMTCKFPFPDGPSPEIRILFMTDGYSGGKGFHLEYRQLPCKSAQPPSANGDGGASAQGSSPSSGEAGNGGPMGSSAMASSDRKLLWVKGFRDKPGIVTASIFVENRGNVTANNKFHRDHKKAS